jgi:hypothetical protein
MARIVSIRSRATRSLCCCAASFFCASPSDSSGSVAGSGGSGRSFKSATAARSWPRVSAWRRRVRRQQSASSDASVKRFRWASV